MTLFGDEHSIGSYPAFVTNSHLIKLRYFVGLNNNVNNLPVGPSVFTYSTDSVNCQLRLIEYEFFNTQLSYNQSRQRHYQVVPSILLVHYYPQWIDRELNLITLCSIVALAHTHTLRKWSLSLISRDRESPRETEREWESESERASELARERERERERDR